MALPLQPLDDGGNFQVLDDVGDGGLAVAETSNIGGGDVSGGSDSTPFAIAAQQIEQFVAEAGGALPIVYGEHLIAGTLVAHSFTLGTPNLALLIIALGEGRGDGGEHGEWEGAVAVYYAGALQSVSGSPATAGYRFYNGFISTAVDSGPQTVDPILPDGLAYSGTAILAIRLTDDDANAEDRPDKLRGRYQGRRTYDYDSTGRRIGYGYSVNPARVAADRIRAYYDHKFPNDTALAELKLQEKVNWESWRAWADFNDELIPWDDGGGVTNIPRFEAHIAFTQSAILADTLDQICATCGAFWQDDGEQIVFFPPTEIDPVHHFDESNIIVAPRVTPRDLRERPNYFIAEFRDFDDPFLGMTSVEVRRESLRAQVGKIEATRAFPVMRQSQAQRLLERQARLEADNPEICSIVGDESGIHVLPGDFVTVSHPVPGWEYQRCLVLSVLVSTGEEAIRCEFVLQKIEGPLYSDTAHGPRQEALTP